MPDEDYDIDRRSVHNLFQGSRKFKVPSYQRSYSWDDDNANRLWADLYEISIQSGNDVGTNLLGAMVVLDRDEKGFEVVDGQQRLATLSLIFSSIRRYIIKLNEDTKTEKSNAAQLVFKNQISKIDNFLNTSNGEPRVILGTIDSDLFKKIVTNKDTNYENFCKSLTSEFSNGKKRLLPSHELLIKNYKALCRLIEQDLSKKFMLNESEEKIDEEKIIKFLQLMNDLIENITQRNHFAFIKVKNRYIAFKIFSTFNFLGQKLFQKDLIKSHLVGILEKNDGKKETMLHNWNDIFDERLEDPDTFLYESFLANHPSGKVGDIKITKENLYKIVDKNYNTPLEIESYVRILVNDAKFLKNLDHPDDLPNDEKYDKLRNDFYGIQYLNARYIRVPILAANNHWGGMENKEFKELVDCLLIFFFKFKFINDKTAEDVRRISSNVTKKIADGEKFHNIIEYILVDDDLPHGPELRIDEETFKKEFSKKMFKLTTKVAKYVLSTLEIKCRENKEDKSLPSFELEHILPKSHTKYWNEEEFLAGMTDEDIKRFKNRLGNLTLLSPKWNRGAGAREFSVKKEKRYSKSSFLINQKYLSKCQKWTSEELLERENKLCELAFKTWLLNHYDAYLEMAKSEKEKNKPKK